MRERWKQGVYKTLLRAIGFVAIPDWVKMKNVFLLMAFGASLAFGSAPYCTVNSMGYWNCFYWTVQSCVQAAQNENAVCQAASSRQQEQRSPNIVQPYNFAPLSPPPHGVLDPDDMIKIRQSQGQALSNRGQALANEEQELKNKELEMRIFSMMTPEQQQAYIERKAAEQEAAKKAGTVLWIALLSGAAVILLVIAGGG